MFCKVTNFLRPCNIIRTKKLFMSNQFNLKGKIAIVTASTEGIGYAIAKRLGECNASVIISSRKENNVKIAVEKLKEYGLDVDGTVCHVGKDEDRKHLINYTLDKKGGIDILVSNAGINPYMGSLLEASEEVWKKIFDVNVISAFMLSKEVIPHLKKREGGSILYVSSIAAYQPIEVLGPYSVSKTALLGLTKSMASTCAPLNIRVNCISPGIIQTKFSEMLTASDDLIDQLRIPMQRVGKPEECAGVAAFLCSDDASYITGESIPVTGGLFSRL